jgi:hypothetical protein
VGSIPRGLVLFHQKALQGPSLIAAKKRNHISLLKNKQWLANAHEKQPVGNWRLGWR